MSGFTTVSAVTRAGEPGAYEATLDARWSVGGKLNGGYLLATMARAAVDADAPEHPHVLAASAHYLTPPDPGAARVETEILRAGRTASQARARLVQDGRTRVEALLTLGRLDPAAEPLHAGQPPVPLPPESACVRVGAEVPGAPFRVDIFDEVEVRLDPSVAGFGAGRPGGSDEVRGWLRFGDGHEPDPFSLLYVLDALPPATLDLGYGGWVPTLELTAYVRAVPAAGPLRVRQRARHLEAGLVDETCEVWDSRDRLVGQAVQLAGVRVPG